ncbi:MAG: hypothetical protein LBO64_03525, partial [Desulfovibrio sp.]|nr:hypothetical protein [Desulfovibrio sp.]
LTLSGQRELLKRAAVPEHSVAFMQAMSGGTAFCEQGFLFLYAEDWLMAVGYPLQEGEKTGFDAAFAVAVKRIALFVSHDLEDLKQVCGRVHVLDS